MDHILETSNRLSEEVKILEDSITKLELYIFSSKIRPLVFGDTFGLEREQIFLGLIQRLNELSKNTTALLEGSREYYGELRNKNIFFQKKNSELSVRFVYNAITKIELTQECIKRISKYITDIKIAKEPRKNQAFSRLIKDDFDSILKYTKEINVMLSDVQGRKQVERNIVNEYQELKNKLIEKNELKTGDILFSFKDKEYFKKEMISNMIKNVTGSQVTHVLVAAKISSSEVKMIDSHEASGGLHLRDFEIIPGELFIVLRPRISHFQIQTLLQKIIEYIKLKPKFSDKKIVGVWASFLISKWINTFTKGYVLVPNFIKTRKSQFFCSEFVNQVFKESGILLTPKSQYSSIVFPSDIIASPYLDYIGLIFDASIPSEEIIKKHLGDVKI